MSSKKEVPRTTLEATKTAAQLRSRKTTPQEAFFTCSVASPEICAEGDPEVLVNLFRKKQLLEANNPSHKAIRPLLFIGHGAMRGVFGGGQAIALEKAGLRDVFDVGVGVSAGAAAVAYFLAGQSELGTKMYLEECATPKFISIPRVFRGRAVMNLKYLTNIFRGKESNKKLDQEKVRRSRTSFYTVATDAETGVSTFIDGKSIPDMVDALHASIAAPGVSSGAVDVHGRPYLDGGASPLPVRGIIDMFHPTDILILANRSESGSFLSDLVEHLFEPLFLRDLPPEVRRVFMKSKREKEYQDALAFVRSQQECRVSIIWADNSVRSSTQNKRILRNAVNRSRIHLSGFLEKAKQEATLETQR